MSPQDSAPAADSAQTIAFWDRRADAWRRRASRIDEHLALYGGPGIDALRLRPGERVLDIGCGPGYCARELAGRVGERGQVLGVDIAPAMIAAARRLLGDRAANIKFCLADAQGADLGPFDAAYARFSVALFVDPVAGLANIRRALRPAGRIACVDWGPRQDNPWMYVPRLALARALDLQPPQLTSGEDRHDATARVAGLFAQAGFDDVRVRPISAARRIAEPTASEDIATLFEEGGGQSEIWMSLDEESRRVCIDAVIEAMDPYRDEGGWSLPGCALLATASAPASA